MIPVDSAEDVAIGPVDQVYPVVRAARAPAARAGAGTRLARAYGR